MTGNQLATVTQAEIRALKRGAIPAQQKPNQTN